MADLRYLRLVEVSESQKNLAHAAKIGVICRVGQETLSLGSWLPAVVSTLYTWTIAVNIPATTVFMSTPMDRLVLTPELHDTLTGEIHPMPMSRLQEEEGASPPSQLHASVALALTPRHVEQILIVRLVFEYPSWDTRPSSDPGLKRTVLSGRQKIHSWEKRDVCVWESSGTMSAREGVPLQAVASTPSCRPPILRCSCPCDTLGHQRGTGEGWLRAVEGVLGTAGLGQLPVGQQEECMVHLFHIVGGTWEVDDKED